MIEKVKGMSISGRCFSEKTELPFFPNTNNRIAIVYGKNGSGKSTISNAFSLISSGELTVDLSAELIDYSNCAVPLSEGSKIFVFNEKYIDQNVKIDADGLGTIVLFGGQVDLQEQIDNRLQVLAEAKKSCAAAEVEREAFEQKSNPISPDYHLIRIKKALQKGWAVTDAEIRGKKINSKLTDAAIEEICGIEVLETAAQLQQQYEETKRLLGKVSDTSKSYPTVKGFVSVEADFEQELCSLLEKAVEKPVLTEREAAILSLIQNGKQSVIEEAKKDFEKKETSFCPYCFRPINEEYKHELIVSIDKVLNKDVDSHKDELLAISFPVFDFDYTVFEELDSELTGRISSQVKTCYALVNRYKTLIEQKLGNIYTPISIAPLGLHNSIQQLNDLLCQLEEKRKEFMDAVQNKETLFENLIFINKKIAHLQVQQMYRDYRRQIRERNAAQRVWETRQNTVKKIQRNLDILEQKKASVVLAIESINNALNYVFFSQGRLSIELKSDKYYLKSNGKNVKPKNISLGERNIIALCYFFTQILSNQEIEKLYQTEELIVIDDPISSFDFENKVGISSFLRYQTQKIIAGNANSKVLFLTHDLSTCLDLQKIAEEMEKSIGKQGVGSPVKSQTFELTGRQLVRAKRTINEYRELLNLMYRYAIREGDDLELTIGNIMRRALESFSTFMYGTGIAEVSFDSKVLKSLGNRSVYFENLMYRLVMNGESHFQNRIYGVKDDFNFIQFISKEEKQRTCKDILCFMYCLSPDHIESYLPDAVSKVKEWVQNIPQNDKFTIIENNPVRVIHLYDTPLSAGYGMDLLDGAVPFEDYETDSKEGDFALKVSGDSMEPEILNGSTVLIKSESDIDDGVIGAFCLNGEVYCKRLLRKEKRTFLCSDNPNYEPIEIHDDDTLRVYGKVVKIIN